MSYSPGQLRFRPSMLFVVMALLVFLVIVIRSLSVAAWVGHATLHLEVTVIESGSDRPLPGATVEIWDTLGTLVAAHTTDVCGAITVVSDEMTSGRSGAWVDSAFIHLPDIRLQVAMEGYQPSEPVWISSCQQPVRPIEGEPWRMALRTELERVIEDSS